MPNARYSGSSTSAPWCSRGLLESNRRQLTQAAQAVAADYGFREAVATRDTDTLVSVLENSGERIGAAMVVLTSLNGKVIAASGLHVKAGTPFPLSPTQETTWPATAPPA